MSRLVVDAELAFLGDLADGTFTDECLTRADLTTVWEMATRYRDLALGLADVSLFILA